MFLQYFRLCEYLAVVCCHQVFALVSTGYSIYLGVARGDGSLSTLHMYCNVLSFSLCQSLN